jgi:hypothetical protein
VFLDDSKLQLIVTLHQLLLEKEGKYFADHPFFGVFVLGKLFLVGHNFIDILSLRLDDVVVHNFLTFI